MHVMHVLGNFGPGGAEMGVVRLINSFPDERVKHSVCSLGPDSSMAAELEPGVPCFCLNVRGRSYTAFRHIARLARENSIDLLHVNNLAPWMDTLAASRLAGCACIETFHGVEQGQGVFRWTKRQIFSFLAERSAAVTAVSEAAGRLLVELTGIEGGHVQVINNGVDCDFFSPCEDTSRKTELRRRLELPTESLILGCIAGLRPVKGHHGLLEAFARVPVESNMRLVFVGSGPEEKNLKELAGELGIKERLHFMGNRQDIADLVRAFDVFVLNSETEGLSYAVLEAMASGLPVAATAVGANPELIESGEQGWLYPPGQTEDLVKILTRIGSNPEILEPVGRKARSRVMESFGYDVMAGQYAELYQKVRGDVVEYSRQKSRPEK